MLPLGRSMEVCVPFFGTKNGGAARLILDTRDSNTFSAEPPYTPLAPVTALAELAIAPHIPISRWLRRRGMLLHARVADLFRASSRAGALATAHAAPGSRPQPP